MMKNRLLLPFFLLACAVKVSAQVVISEFMASNSTTVADENGSYEDWIELYNTSATTVSLEGWALTDDATVADKWTFPQGSSIGPREYLLVWASNKNRRVPGSPLHTNFKLSADGEYLALMKPDHTPATEFAPAYPPQLTDVSYGPAAQASRSTLLQQGSAGKVLIPSNGTLAATWTGADFNDTAWTAATNGIGYETGGTDYGPPVPGNLQDGPAAYYRLGETAGTGIPAANAGSSAAAGSYLGGVTQNVDTLTSPAYPGFETDNRGARFNGASHKVDVPWNAANNGASFSFSLWMKWNGANTGAYKSPLTSRESTPQRGYIAYVNPTTQVLSFWTGAETAWSVLDAPAATGTIAANQWYHIAGTYNGTTKAKILYLNGGAVASGTAATFSRNTVMPLRIGGGGTEGAGQFWFPGDIDEVAVFDRALSAAEITAQYTTATAGANAPAVILGQTPGSYWRLKDSATPSATAAVNQGSTGAAANGVYTGSPVLGVDGPRPPSEAGMPADNKAMRANAAGYVEAPFQAALNAPVFSVECWARATGGAGTYRAAVSSPDDDGAVSRGYILYAGSDNTWQFWTGSGTAGTWDPIAGPAVTLNTWVHLVGTFDGTVKRFYVNGTLAGTGTLSTFNPNTSRPLRIGAGTNEAAANFLFAGDVDEVAIYSRALSAGEVSERYLYAKNNTPPAGPQPFAGLIGTSLQSRMQNVNATAYYRLPFTLADPAAVAGLTLRMKYDDGFQAWINGVPVAGGNVPDTLAWNSAASASSTTADALTFEDFNANAALSSLRAGQNVLAIQGLNASAADSDFLQLAQLEALNSVVYSTAPVYLTAPTPGKVNGTGTATPGPAITLEKQTPMAPAAADDLVLTCQVKAVFSPIASVTLIWQAGYNTLQQTVMKDNGTGGDTAAGDGIYTAVIPKTAYTAGAMVRWYFTAANAAGQTTRWPFFTAGDEAREYFGTMIAATGFTTTLPVWYWFTQNTAAASTRAGTRGSVFYQGEFYDNVFIRLRGGATSTGSKKFDFNSGNHCRIDDTIGRVEEANLNGTSLSSGIAGDSADATLIRPALAYEVFRVSGHPAGYAFPVMMRVNGTLDTGSGRGGIAYFVEQVDERYLRRNNLDDTGALYKMDQRANLNPVFFDSTDGVQKRTRLDESNADLQALVDGIHSPADGYNFAGGGNNPAAPNPPAAFPAARKTWLFDHADLANMVNYLACRAIIGDSDDTRKNFHMYRDTNDTGEWRILPWDKDGTFGIQLDDTYYNHPFKGDYARRKSPGNGGANQWNYLWEALYNEPATRAMYLRRLRTLMDTILQPAPGGYLQGRADAWWAPVAPHKAGATPAAIKTWLATRRTELFTTYSAANSLGTGVQIPGAQKAAVVVNFGAVDANPASGNQDEEYVELVNPDTTAAVDISGWRLKRGVEHTFAAGTVILPGGKMIVAGKTAAFRARTAAPRGGQDLFVQGNYKGTISARGETIELWDPKDPALPDDDRLVATLTTPANPTPAQQALRITKLMYDPTPGGNFAAGDYEWLELMNTGTTTLTLTGARFTEGVTFTFGTTVLNAGARILLVKNQAAFESRYGAGLPVAGVFTGALDNSGERLRLVDAAGEEVLDFRYGGDWYPFTHGDTATGGGAALVIEDPAASWDTWGSPLSWRATSGTGGSPGMADPLPAIPVITGTTGATLQIKGVPGRSYLLQRSADLGAWTDLDLTVAGPDGTLNATDPAPPTSRSFYRIRAK